jgi:hypothetical protein
MTINRIDEEIVNIDEGERLLMICRVDGKPIPTISIRRDSQANILKTSQANFTYVSEQQVQCDATDTYRCTATTADFTNSTEVSLNVLCKHFLFAILPLRRIGHCLSTMFLSNFSVHAHV